MSHALSPHADPDTRDVMVVMSVHLFDPDNHNLNASICMHDTHKRAECQKTKNGGTVDMAGGGGGDGEGDGGDNIAAQNAARRHLKKEEGVALDIDLQTYAVGAGWTPAETAAAVSKSLGLLSKVMYHRNAVSGFQKSPVNRRILIARARCFSLLRADLGISESFEPSIYEINDWPFIDDEGRGTASQVLWRAHRELFQMLQLDTPSVPNTRAKLDESVKGRWQLLSNGWEATG